MNRRIRRKKAKQLYRHAALMAAESVKLEACVAALRHTGPVIDELRQRARFRSRRYEGEAIASLAQAVSLAG